jgi:putative oxidoreductase
MSNEQQGQLYIPALAKIYPKFNRWAAPILRIVTGGILIPHGCQKLFGWFGGIGLTANAQLFDRFGYSPGIFWGTLVGLTEVTAGILLVIGLFTRPAALAIAIFMINAVYFTSNVGGFFWTKGGSEYSLLILAVAVHFLIRGGGPYSVDRAVGHEF